MVDLTAKVISAQNLEIWKELRELTMQICNGKHSRQREQLVQRL